jgi:phosphatidate cytidylyltransferase
LKNLLTRTLTGIIFVGVIAGAICFGEASMQLLFLFISLLTLNEFINLVKTDEINPSRFIVIAAAVIIYISVSRILSAGYEFLSFSIFPLLFISELFRKKSKPFHSIVYGIGGIIYTVIPFALLARMSINNYIYAPVIPLSFFLILWSSDTFAYLVGMKLGRHKLFERISPGKTWEGSIGGMAAACCAAFVIYKSYGVFSLVDWMIIALIIVITGTLGDLTESMLKRSLNVKDSGKFLPGHGGLLDRFDAMLLAVPSVYIYLLLR